MDRYKLASMIARFGRMQKALMLRTVAKRNSTRLTFMKAWIGIDNGCTGSIAMVTEGGNAFMVPTPTKKEQSYTKTIQQITRIDSNKLYSILLKMIESSFEMVYDTSRDRVLVIMERPFTNPKFGMKATISAMRSLEATLVVCESLHLAVQYIDSREWQKALLPAGAEGAERKRLSLEIGCRLFPHIECKMKDRDSLLIAEHARRQNF